MILLMIIIYVLSSTSFSYYKQAKRLEVNPTKWILIGMSSFIFIAIPFWVLINILTEYIFTEQNLFTFLIDIVIFLIFSVYVRNFLYKKMEEESSKMKNNDDLLDDIEF